MSCSLEQQRHNLKKKYLYVGEYVTTKQKKT